MEFRLDHVVIAVTELAQAVDDYRALGFTVTGGGRHPGRTSHNALVVFDDGAYLELIAWAEPGPAERWYNVLQEHGEGLIDFALIPEDVPRAIDEARSRGLGLTGPVEGSRMRPDGVRIEWGTARQATFDLPFLCGDVTPRELRVPTGAVRSHANGASGVAGLTIAVHDLQRSLSAYGALLGARLREAVIEVGATQLVLEERTGAREGVCGVCIATDQPSRRLDPALTHDAAIELHQRRSRVT